MQSKKLDYGVIDDFLPVDEFKFLQELLLPSKSVGETPVGFVYVPSVTFEEKGTEEDWRLFNLSHLVYEHTILSPFVYKQIEPINDLLGIRSLIRIKINMFPNTLELAEHGMHIDYDFPHKTALFSINTCNGYTKLEDGTKIDSVANRMLIFDGRINHTSSTCTNQPVRVNINFNYF